MDKFRKTLLVCMVASLFPVFVVNAQDNSVGRGGRGSTGGAFPE